MNVKLYRNADLINKLPRKTIAGAMLAGGILASSLSSCTAKPDAFQKENIEYLAQKEQNTSDNKVYKIQAKPQIQKAGINFISKEDSPFTQTGKRLTTGLLASLLGALAGSFRGNKSFLNKTSQCACVGAAAGILFPSLTLTTIITGLSAIVGGFAGSYFSGGNEKAGKIGAIISALIAAGGCLL